MSVLLAQDLEVAEALAKQPHQYRLLERQYGEAKWTDIRFACDQRDDYTLRLAQRQMDARSWYWHAIRGADIELDEDGRGFVAVCRDGARTILAEVIIQELL